MLRAASPELIAALASGQRLWAADLFAFTLADGTTVERWTSWDSDLSYGGHSYSSKAPWLKRSKWGVTNTLQVPSLTVYLAALMDGFAGGAAIITQIENGLFDGATFLLTRVFMPSPGDTATLGGIDIFGGDIGAIDSFETQATIRIKGKSNRLDQGFPRNLYQIGCNHAFCDPGCTLSRGAFTTAYVVGTSPTENFIPWSGSPPGNAANYSQGTLVVTTGAGAGQRRTITAADATGLALAYPLYVVPEAGDDFTAFEGCDKSFDSGSGRSCTDRSNTQHYRGFEFVPQPSTAI
jgi:uncharacterized phage protein (TIGR02218 family)